MRVAGTLDLLIRRRRGRPRLRVLALALVTAVLVSMGVSSSTWAAIPVGGGGRPADEGQLGAAVSTTEPVDTADARTRVSGEWQLVYLDDFETLNTSVWGVLGGDGNGHTGPRSRENTFVSGGNLILRTTKIDGVWHGAGVTSSKGNLGQTYGKFKIRARFEPGRGVKGAALLWPSGAWPPEIDFYEIFATDPERSTNSISVHYRDVDSNHRIIHRSVAGDYTQWHVIGVQWTPTQLRFTLDGRVVATVDEQVPQQTMALGLRTGTGNVAIGGDSPDATTPDKVDLVVDWVQIYRWAGPVG